MFYRELPPDASLRGQVDCIWVLEYVPGPDPMPEKILPDGRCELIFHLAAPYRRVEPEPAPAQPRSLVVGQLRRYLEVVPTGKVSVLGVRLEPTALHRLLGSPLHELTDRTVALEELGCSAFVELASRLQDADGWKERVRLVEAGLRGPLARSAGLMGEAVHMIRRTHGTLELSRVAQAVGVGLRTLDRRFATEVGLTPKLFSRQVRLQRVFDLLAGTPRPSWSQVALASGCFDQAHLNREFRAFTGESPSAFLRSCHALSDHLTGLASGDGARPTAS